MALGNRTLKRCLHKIRVMFLLATESKSLTKQLNFHNTGVTALQLHRILAVAIGLPDERTVLLRHEVLLQTAQQAPIPLILCKPRIRTVFTNQGRHRHNAGAGFAQTKGDCVTI